MADLLELSARIIDEGIVDEPVNRITQELSEVADGVAVIESFSHVVVFPTGDGLVLFDTSGALTAERVVASLRAWSEAPVDTIVYTHGHELVELAVQAEPESRDAHGARADIYGERRRSESSLMAKGIYGFAARESRAVIDGSG